MYYDLPYNIRMSVTDGCNRSCNWCPIENRGQATPNYTIFERFRDKWLPNIPSGINKIVFSQDGEPLLNKDIVKIVELCSDKSVNKKRKTLMISNTDVLIKNPELLEDLFNAGLFAIQLNLYQKDKSKYDGLKPVLKRLMLNKVQCMVTNEGSGIFATSKKSVFLVPTHFEEKKENSRTRSYHSCAGALPMTDEEIHRAISMKNAKCTNPFTHLTIAGNGTIGFCCVDIMKTISFGNIEKVSLRDVWQSAEMHFIRQKLYNNQRGDLYPCMFCYVKSSRVGLYQPWQEIKGDVSLPVWLTHTQSENLQSLRRIECQKNNLKK
jgi:MoaA/NifB/PqqE/SkfB family radical SAM enzyme